MLLLNILSKDLRAQGQNQIKGADELEVWHVLGRNMA